MPHRAGKEVHTERQRLVYYVPASFLPPGRMVANAVMDEHVRALRVSMAQTWTKLAEAMERLAAEGLDRDSPRQTPWSAPSKDQDGEPAR